jgi:V/A-type H+-transporting ATPase subunit I
VESIEDFTSGRVAIRVFEPNEVREVKSGNEIVPTALKHGRFVSSFERLIISYGAPLYGTIDPTPIVAVFFIVLFAIMFGDVGQGLVIFLIGFILSKAGIKGTEKWKVFAPIFEAVGLASAIAGILYGSVFCNDKIMNPIERTLTAFIFGTPRDRVVPILPEGSVNRLFVFFGFTVGVGVLLNSIGLIINLFNQIHLRRWEKAFFSKTGLAGALLFWYSLFFAVRLSSGGSALFADVIGFCLPLLALLFGSPLMRLFAGKRPVLEHGIFSFVIEGFVELLETISYYLSNTISFLRVGAFALAHVVLSLIVFTMSELLGERLPGGLFFSTLVMVTGNIIIIGLEGMIVAIQVVRLQYYEFFSKFFAETGEIFSPFTFAYKRLGT